MLDVGRLRVLLAVSEHGELPAAARALGTPPPDAAAQLSALERELGLPLAEGDRLTPAGRRLAGHAGRLLAQLEAAESDAAAVAGRAAGVLRLGIGAAAGRALLPDALATLRSAAPDLDLRVQQLIDERVTALGTERLDVAVIGEFAAAVPRRTDPDVQRRELLTEPLLVAVPARHRLTGASVRLADLADERWVGGPVGGDALTALERVAAGAGFEPRLVGHAAEDGLALALVAAGLGVALVPASSVPVPVDGVRFLTAVDAGLRRTVTAVVRRSAAADPAVVRLLDALSQAARRVAAAVSGVTASAAPTPPPVTPPITPGRDLGARERRPDPLFDPLPPAERGGDVPRPRRRAAEPAETNGYANGNGSSGLEAFRTDPGRGRDPLRGDAGRDPLGSGSGPDPLRGDATRDPFRSDNGARDPLRGERGRDPLSGDASRDPFRSDNGARDPLRGDSRRSPLPGDAGRDPLRGESPRDPAPGDAGDPFRADTGRDPLSGGPDPLQGGGRDPLRGDAGRDPFRADNGSRDASRGSGRDPVVGENTAAGLEAFRAEAYRPDPPRAEPPRIDPPRAEPPRVDPPRAEPRVEPGRPDPYRAEQLFGGGEPRNGRSTPAGSPTDREPPRRRRDSGPLPPPGVPADRPRPAAAAEPPPIPHPTSPDLGVRSLSAGDLPGRRPTPPASPTPPGPARRAGAGSYAERAGSPRRARDDAPDSLPPAPAGRAEDVRLSIFEDLQSEWFTRRDDDTPPATSWQTSADDGWRAAARLAEPATAGTTTAGLPRRRPQALYVPGTAGGEAGEPGSTPNGAAARSAEDVRGRLSSYRDGVRRGRHAEPRED